MTRYLIAPTERPPISSLGPTSSLCEKLGCDILWDGLAGPCGAQRKTTSDLIASVRGESGDRLGRELEQMRQLSHRFLVIEGQAQWTQSGELISQHTRWTIKQQHGVEISAQMYGVIVLHTRSALETCSTLEHLYDWSQKEHDTSSLLSRGKASRNGWGRPDDRATCIHVWSSIPAVGQERAKRIFDAGIKLIRCGTTIEELMTVDGIGLKTASTIVKSLNG